MMLTIEAEEAWWPPTLTPDGRLPHAVGVVDDARGEPEHAVLHRFEQRRLVVAVWLPIA